MIQYFLRNRSLETGSVEFNKSKGGVFFAQTLEKRPEVANYKHNLINYSYTN